VSEQSIAAVHELLRQSLSAWRVAGEVVRAGDGSLLLTAGGKQLRISRTAEPLPFRWRVVGGEKSRGAASVSGLLRVVRAAIDPDYRPVRLRIAPLPLVPS
jgi:hypothetical protein